MNARREAIPGEPGINFVTGASGHLGANLVRALLERGERVRVIYRDGSDNRAIESLRSERFEAVKADLTNLRSLETAMEGCSRVYHCAAYVSIRNRDKKRLFNVNILGTRFILQAARRVGVSKVVHCSSFGAVGHNPEGSSNEHWVIDPFEVGMDYERAKAFAEQEVLRAALDGQNATIVNPSGIVGPWDYKPSMVGKTMLDFANGKLRAFVQGGFDFVPVYDVVQGHLLAMDKGVAGRRYLLTGEQASLEQIISWWGGWIGRKVPRKIPHGAVLRVAGIKDWIEARVFPDSIPRFNRNSIRLLNSNKHGDNSRARRELGLVPTRVEDAFHAQMQWFIDHGFIERPSGYVDFMHPCEPRGEGEVGAADAAE